MPLGSKNRRPGGMAGGFFRPSPWVRSAQNLPNGAVRLVSGLVLVAAGIWTLVALVGAGSQPVLPSSHSVPVSLAPTTGSRANGGGHIVWYRQGQLLVVAVTIRDLQPSAPTSVFLVPEGSCRGKLPSGARVVGRIQSDSRGLAQFNGELLGVSNLRFSSWSIWIQSGAGISSPAACGVISVASGSPVTS